jgi:hypothetical protein
MGERLCEVESADSFYFRVDGAMLDLARLIDLAVVTHSREAIEERPISEFGPSRSHQRGGDRVAPCNSNKS